MPTRAQDSDARLGRTQDSDARKTRTHARLGRKTRTHARLGRKRVARTLARAHEVGVCGGASVRGWGCRSKFASTRAHVRGHLPDGPRRRILRAKRFAAEFYPLVQSSDQWSKSGQTVCGDRQPARALRGASRDSDSPLARPGQHDRSQEWFVLRPNGGRRDGGRSNAGPG